MTPVTSDQKGNANGHDDQTDRPKNDADCRKIVREQQGDGIGKHGVPPLHSSIPACDLLHTIDSIRNQSGERRGAISDRCRLLDVGSGCGIPKLRIGRKFSGWLGYR